MMTFKDASVGSMGWAGGQPFQAAGEAGSLDEGTPEGYKGYITWLYGFSNDQVPKMSLSFSKRWPTLYGVFVVHGPPPYKNCPPEQFLATSTAFCIFTPQMGSVSLCRSDPGPTVRG